MDGIEKQIRKMSPSEQEMYRTLLHRIIQNDLAGLNVRKLKEVGDVFRVRVGKWRIVFTHQVGKNEILRLGRRNESTYRDL